MHYTYQNTNKGTTYIYDEVGNREERPYKDNIGDVLREENIIEIASEKLETICDKINEANKEIRNFVPYSILNFSSLFTATFITSLMKELNLFTPQMLVAEGLVVIPLLLLQCNTYKNYEESKNSIRKYINSKKFLTDYLEKRKELLKELKEKKNEIPLKEIKKYQIYNVNYLEDQVKLTRMIKFYQENN